MCGIAGIVSKRIDRGEREALTWRMVQTLRHRGPDDQQMASTGCATLGVARLSIVDRAAAKQPMAFELGGKHGLIAYNGEVYNFLNLRQEFVERGVRFATYSDTELVLASHLQHGHRAPVLFDGMFAYAVWDAASEELILVRDRLGIKPLFYVDLGDAFLFASEPKALFHHPRLARNLDPTAMLEYFLHGATFASGYVTQQRSFFDRVRQLLPGHFLVWNSHGSRIERYWSLLDEPSGSLSDREAAQEHIAEEIHQGVQAMLMGEVPVGTALSGGLDSSLITSEAAAACSGELVSACITYREDHNDTDAHHAELLSKWLNRRRPGSHHLEYTRLDEQTYLQNLDEMIAAFDEPHWEIRQLAMFENYRTLARLGQTVVLTGEGADELFLGYYQKFPGFRSPQITKPADFAAIWRQRLPLVKQLLAPAFASRLLSTELANDLIDHTVGAYLLPYWQTSGDRLRAVQAWYMQTFLPWLLMVNDRCSMAHSLEGRFPFLARRVVTLAWQLPPEWNIGDSGGPQEKVLLRYASRHRLPQEIWQHRAKSPLPVPQDVAYHRAIAHRLAVEIEGAPSEVWDWLNRDAIVQMISCFRERVDHVGSYEGDALMAYIPLGDRPVVRTVNLFAILSFLRWCEVCLGLEPKRSMK